MEYDGSKLKVRIDKKDDDYCIFQVLEMPEEWRGKSTDGSHLFEASNGWKIVSCLFPAIGWDGLIYLRGDNRREENNDLPLFAISRLDYVVTALREFGATIVGDAVCNDHEWVTIYKGDPIYEGTFCKNCREKQDGV